MTVGDDYGEADAYGDIAYADTPPVQGVAGSPSAPPLWPVWGSGSPEAGQRVTAQQALYYNNGPTVPGGVTGAPGTSPYYPSYDTPSVIGGPDTYHVTLDGRLLTPAAGSTGQGASALSGTSGGLAPDQSGLLKPPPDLIVDGLLSVPPDLASGDDDFGILSASPARWPPVNGFDTSGFDLPDRLSRLHSPPPPPAAPPVERPWFGGSTGAWTGDPNSRPNMSFVEDAGRSFVTGLEQGGTSLAGAPGSFADWLDKRVDDGIVGGGTALGLVRDQDDLRRRLYAASDAERRKSILTRYTTGDLDDMVQSAAGPYHAPQTVVGRLANAVGQNAPSALIPGGAAVRVARVVTPALGSTVAGELTDQNPWAKAGGELLGGVLVAGGEGLLARPADAPQRFTTGTAIDAPAPSGQTSVNEGGVGATFGSASTSSYRSTFLKANPELKGQVVVHHAVPQLTLRLYPDAVSAQEIHSLENLRGIPNEINTDLHLGNIGQEWKQFYMDNPNANKAKLIQKATDIDQKYGDQFKPPVRIDK